MQTVFFRAFLSLFLVVKGLQAQVINQPLPSGLKPRIGVIIFSDGKPINQREGIKADTKEIRFKAFLDTKTNEFFAGFQPEMVIKQTKVILARNGRIIGQGDLNNNQLSTDFLQNALPEDRVVFKFTVVAQRKNGELVPMSESPTYNFPIQK